MLNPALPRGQLSDTATRLLATRDYGLDVCVLQALKSERKQLQGRTQELQNPSNTRFQSIGRGSQSGQALLGGDRARRPT